MKPEFIVWHCSASSWGTTGEIRNWHLARGWSGIGYHGVVLNGYLTARDHREHNRVHWLDGSFEMGRRWDGNDKLDDAEVGAHAYGLNRQSVGLCLIGKGGVYTWKQIETALNVTRQWQRQFSVVVSHVIGHNEIGTFFPEYAMTKRCPNLDMSFVRDVLRTQNDLRALTA